LHYFLLVKSLGLYWLMEDRKALSIAKKIRLLNFWSCPSSKEI